MVRLRRAADTTDHLPGGGEFENHPGSGVTVVICAYTRDRWGDLLAAVDSIRMQTLQPEQTLVVIDHNPELLGMARARIAGRGLRVQVVENTGPKGLSGARNTGLAAATGRIVAFLDDDAFADRRWLEHLVAAYADANVVAVGGRIVPSWETGRPQWFPEEFDWVIGCTYRGMPEARGPVRNVIGANMSFRRDVLAAIGGFSPELGRTADAPLGDEETEACILACQATPDGIVLHEPAAVVAHWVPDSRCTRRYFRERCYGEGISKARLTGRLGSTEGLSSERSYTLRTLPAGVRRYLGEWITGKDRAGLARSGALVSGLSATAAGYARGLLGRAAGRVRAFFGSPSADEQSRPPSPPRVLVVTPRFPPLMGGVENHVLQVARRMGTDMDVTVLTTDIGGTLPREETVEGVRVRRVRAWPQQADYYFAPAIWRTVTHGDWDLVHIQSYHTAVAPLAMLAALDAGVPYVVTFHGGGHSSAMRNRLRGLQRRILRPLLARAEKLIAVAQFEADFYSEQLRIPAERFAVIPNGSDLPLPDPAPVRVPGDAPLLVSIGRLEEYKGHHRVVEAMPEVLRQVPGARLLVLGTGPYRDAIAETAERLGVAEHVEIRAIPAEERAVMAETLASASLVVSMSSFETHPLAIIEALAVGTPALVAETSGLKELADRGLARAVPLDADASTVAAAIVSDLRDARTVPDIALPTWEQCARNVQGVYREALDADAPPAANPRPERTGTSLDRLSLVAALAGCGMLAVALADNAGREGLGWAVPLFWFGLALIFAPAALMLMPRDVSRREALGTVIVVGMALYVVSVLDNPTLFTGFDELLHYRTLDDLVRTGRIFTENPLLPISPYFPGLELATFALMSLTGLSGFASGVIVVGTARLLGVIALFLLIERTGLDRRLAGLGTLMYMTAPSFLFFDAQFAYESLALPLATLVLFTLREAQLQRSPLRRRLNLLAALLVFAVVMTHHVTSYILTGALLAWLLGAVVFRRRFSEPLPGRAWVPLFAAASVVGWFLVVARKTAAYLWPHLGGAMAELMRIIGGESQTRRLFQSAGGQSAPIIERLVGLLAVALVLGLIFFGIGRVRGYARRTSIALLLGITVLAYPAAMALRFSQVGWQVGSRAMAFIYVGLAFVFACGLEAVREFRRFRLGPVALALLATVTFAGGVIAGSTTGRVTSPYRPGAGKASIEAEGVGAATWARTALGPGNRVAADSTNSSLMGSYGQQRTLSSADGISVSGLFLAPEFGDYQRTMIAEADIEYVVVDRRIANVLPFQGFFFEKWEKQVVDYGSTVSTETVGRFDTLAHASRIFDSGNIQLYDVRGLGQ